MSTIIANPDSFLTDEDSALALDVLANDTDSDATAVLSILGVDAASASGATLTVNADGTIRYDATSSAALDALAQGETATDTFSYVVADQFGATAQATVTVTVTGVNDAPVASADAIATDEDTPVVADVLANDADPDAGGVLSLASVDATSALGAAIHFGLTFDDLPDQTTLAAGYGGFDWTAVAGSVNVFGGVTFGSPDALATANYGPSGLGDSLTAPEVVIPVNGVQDTAITRHDGGTFTFGGAYFSRVQDVGHVTLTALNGTTVVGSEVIDLGTADFSSAYAFAAGFAGPITALDIHSDVAGWWKMDDFSFGGVAPGANATVIYDPTQSAMLDALARGETATDSFDYVVQDQFGATATATATVTVAGLNDAPVAHPDVAATDAQTTIAIAVLGNDGDPDHGAVLATTSVDATSAAGATLAVAADGTVAYDPTSSASLHQLAAGATATDTFRYVVADEFGATATATVTVTVTGVAQQVVANNDTAQADEDTPVAVSVLDNDLGTGLVVTGVDAMSAAGAALGVNADGTVHYDPTPSASLDALAQGETATDTFSYEVADATGATATATVTVTVTGRNDAPVAVDDVATTDQNALVVVEPLANDADADHDHTFSLVSVNTAGTLGTVSINPAFPDVIVYDPNGAFTFLGQGASAVDSFSYVMRDEFGATSTATVNVTVKAFELTTRSDSVSFTAGTNVVNGVLGPDGTATLNRGDSLTGGSGTDTLVLAGTGSFDLNGTLAFTGFERVVLTAPGDSLTLKNGESLTVTGTAGAEAIIGGTGNDTIIGNGGGDSLVGGTGNDSIGYEGGAVIHGDAAAAAAGIGTDTLVVAGAFALGIDLSQAANQDLSGSSLVDGFERVDASGDLLAVSLKGTSGANALLGGAGNDTIIGNGGVDTIFGGAGSDRITYGTGQMHGDAGAGAAAGADGDTLVLNANAGGRSFNLAAANQDANGGQTVDGFENVDASADTSPVTLVGSAGANVLLGGGGADNIDGGAGNDSLAGGAGIDTITGGLGRDTLTGGAGVDHFVYTQALGAAQSSVGAVDVITDFTHASDTIDVNGFAFTAAQKTLVSAGVVASFTTAAANGYFAGGAVKAEYAGGAAQVYVDADKNGSFDPTRDVTIHLDGVAPGTLTLADFRFG